MKKSISCIKAVGIMMLAAIVSLPALADNYKTHKAKNLEGEKISQVSMKMRGVDYTEQISEDGQSIEKVPYHWFAGTAIADNKQLAIEMAQREAFNSISRSIATTVKDCMQKSTIGNNANTVSALKGKWSHVSENVIVGCEPMGDVVVEYNKKTKMYEATAKVGISDRKFREMMGSPEDDAPDDLTSAETEAFVQTNKAIFDSFFDF